MVGWWDGVQPIRWLRALGSTHTLITQIMGSLQMMLWAQMLLVECDGSYGEI